MTAPLRMGRISYLNVLPIYHPLEAGIIPHDYELVSGPPALLNEMMGRGELQVSSCSCFEYARRPEAEVRTEAGQAALDRLKTLLYGYEIIDKWVDYCMIEDDTLAATATAEWLMDIAGPAPA